MQQKTEITTVGHSNHTLEAFIDLLKQHDIDLIVDVRSQPYSRWADQFNRESLREALNARGFHYRYRGEQLGGRPKNPKFYDPGETRPNYKEMATVPVYQRALDELIAFAQAQRTVVMCSEGDHRQCHRHLLITQSLLKRGLRVHHIQPDGSLVEGVQEAEQLSLFG
jgi:uncharacterized protein (DUF488 family)